MDVRRMVQNVQVWGVVLSTFLSLRVAVSQTTSDVTVMRMGGTTITAAELSERLNLAPRMDAFKPDSSRRKAMAASVIATYVLAREAERNHLDTLDGVRTAIQQSEKEAVYEEWMKERITDKISLTEQEIRHGYRRLIEDRVVDYAVFPDTGSARRVRQKVLAGQDLSSMTVADGKPVSQSKVIRFAEALGDVEDAVYGLKVGEVSRVIPVENRYYVFQLEETRSNPTYANHDFAYWREAVVKRLRSRKEQARFGALMSTLMATKRFTINRNVYDYVLAEVAKRIPFGNQELLQVPEFANGEFVTVPDDVRTHFRETMMRFDDGEQWTVGDFWEQLRFGPYLLNYQSQEDLERDFPQLIRTMVLTETIMKKGFEEKLDTTAAVKRETRMWKDDLLAKIVEHAMLDTLHVTGEDIHGFYDAHAERFTGPGWRRILEITLSDRALAFALIDRIRNGEDMKALVKQCSLSPTREKDADEGILLEHEPGNTVSRIAFQLPEGGLYGPIDLDSTHVAIIRVEEIIKGDIKPFDTVSAEVKSELTHERIAWATGRLVSENVRRYRISIDKRAIEGVTVLKGTMLVRKSHFPNRMAVPLALPADENSPWFQSIWYGK